MTAADDKDSLLTPHRFPLSFAQEGIWLASKARPESPHFNLSCVLRGDAPLDLTSLEKSLATFVARHAVLRLRFHEINGSVSQEVLPYQASSIALSDFGDVSEEEVKVVMRAAALEKFDLLKEPVFRARVYRTANNWYFQFVAHHIAMDGGSGEIFVDEIMETYLKGPTLRPLPAPYKDFVVWQRGFRDSQEGRVHAAFWREYLLDFVPSKLEFPGLGFKESGERDDNTRTFSLTPTLLSKMEALKSSTGCSSFTIMLAAYALVLGRYNGRRKQYCVIPSSNRPHPAFKGTAGHFVNNLLVCIDLNYEQSITDFLKATYASIKLALTHQSYPLQDIFKEIGLQTLGEKEAALAMGFGWLKQKEKSKVPKGYEVIPSEQYGVSGDSLLAFYEGTDSLHGEFITRSDLYPPALVDRILGDLTFIVSGLCEGPMTLLRHLPLLAPLHEMQIKSVEKGPIRTLDPGTLLDRFEREVIARGKQAALAFDGQWISYEELNARANQVAAQLAQRGIGRGSIIAVALPRSHDLIVSLIGVLKAGAAYLPIDSHLPLERIQYMVDDAGAQLILVSSQHLSQFSKIPQALTYAALLAEKSGQTRATALRPHAEDICYLVYTSGSSGRPKGVAISHRALLNQIDALVLAHDLDAQTIVGSFTSISFDIFAAEFFLPLSSGMKLALLETEIAADPLQLGRFIDDMGISFFLTTPLILRHLVKSSWKGNPALKVICGGEAFPHEIVAELPKKFKAVWNAYGPSEATVCTTARLIRTSEDAHSIGRPHLNYTVSIRDERHQLLAMGGLGEIYIGGPGLAHGYWRREELNQDKFIEDPLFPHERLYRSGDLGVWLENGELRTAGRIDNQVKLRGLRIELEEIEQILFEQGSVAAAQVLVHDSDAALVAFVVLQEHPGTDAQSPEEVLRRSLQQKLPDYMIPQYWQFIDALPLLSNGKVDRKALQGSIKVPLLPVAKLASGNPMEESLEAIVCAITERKSFGAETPFFAGGVESIHLMQIAAEIKAVLRQNIDFKTLSDLGTIRAVAQHIEAKSKSFRSMPPSITRQAEAAHYPVSLSQRRMWVLQRLQPETIAYNMPVLLKIRGPLHIAKLKRAIDQLIQRHDVLRSSYQELDGELRAIIHPEVSSPLEVIDLRANSFQAQAASQHPAMREALARAFDLKQAPLMRILLCCVSEDEHLLLVNKHHIISDQWSYGIFFKELIRLYQEKALDPLQLPIRYVDYAIWQAGDWNARQLDEQLHYWKKQLNGVGIVEVRPDFPRPTVQTSHGALVRLPLEDSMIEGILKLGRDEHLTPYMILLACFQVLLHKYTGLTDIQVGSPIANRSESLVAPLFGTFVNTIVLRADLSKNPNFLDFLYQVKETTLAAFQHQDLSFEALVQALGIERDMSHTPLVQILFNVVNTPFEIDLPQDWQASILDIEPMGAQFDLAMTIDYKVSKELILNFNTDLYKRSTAERIAQHYMKVLETVLRHPQTPLGAIELVDDAMRQTLLLEWNQTHCTWPHDHFLQQFEEIALRHSQAIAIKSEKGNLSYAQLWEQSDRIAAWLLSQGLVAEDFVGVHMERIPLLLPVLLGIMKAGAAYLPLDPHFPEQRVTYYLADSQARFLISDRGAAPADFSGVLISAQQLQSDLDGGRLPPLAKRPLNPRSLAYVIYTSGSTGKPKGVPIQHFSLANFLYSMAETLAIPPKGTLLAVTSVSFDIHGLELFLPLMQGSSLYLASKDQSISGQVLKDLIETQNISVMQATPSTWRILIDAGWKGKKDFQMLCGGEALPRELVRALLSRVGMIWNLYGPTETTIWSSMHRITSDNGPLYIGKPIANTQVYVLDQELKLVPPLVSGELYIGGDGLSPGYLGRPELTSERFIDHPFSPGTKLYRTGDYALWHENGLLECLGRVDNQIKLNGFRIEIGEIEAQLAQAMGSQDVAVVLKKAEGGRQALVGYVAVPFKLQDAFDAQTVLKKMAAFLPNYMIPSSLVPLDALPLTPNLKVDYQVLRTRRDPSLQSSAKLGPQNALEGSIMEIWKDILGLDTISRSASFFELGGDSIRANRLTIALSKKFDTDIPLKLIFIEPTIEGLARTLRDQYPVRDFRIVFPVRQTQAEINLFLVPGAYDHASRIAGYENDVLRYFANLLPHFPDELNVFGLRMIGIYPEEEALYAAQDIAARYRIEIQKVQPRGPYLIAGECVGGLVAYELAQQLQAAGEEVAYLGLYDTINPTTVYRWNDFIYFLFLRLRDLRNEALMFMKASTPNKLALLRSAWKSAKSLLRFTRPQEVIRAIRSSDYYRVFALLRYRPQPYAGTVTLIANSTDSQSMAQFNWERIAINKLTTLHVPGNHVTRLSLYSKEMGRVMRAGLEETIDELQGQRPQHFDQKAG